jgi:regulator of replication initiation timing
LVETVGQLELDFAAAQKEFADALAENARLRLENEEMKAANEALAAKAARDAVVIAQLKLELDEARRGPMPVAGAF